MKRILVAGGAGFVGSHLCDRLVAEGDHVICVDNFHTGARQNILHHRGDPSFEFIEHDITKPLKIAGPLDEIYNLACPASPVHYQADPHYTVMVNVVGSYNLLELARAKGARILLASSSEVYGDPLQHPQNEEDRGNVSCTGPRACYDEGKRCAEALYFDARRMHGTEVKVARIFNTYGPRMLENDGRVVSNFAVQALRGDAITVYGDGSQTRSFCYVDDLVDGLIRLMRSGESVSVPVNLGNPQEITVLEFAHRIGELAGRATDIVFEPLPQDDPRRRRPDISRAGKLLGWSPKTPLEAGLRLTIAYFRDKLAQGEPLRRVNGRERTVEAQPRGMMPAASVVMNADQ
jgi:UDP-glucuronate decarboxylase